MAIKLNKYAVRCEKIALESGKISLNAPATPILYDISRNWRKLMVSTNFISLNMAPWSEKEEAAADVIISTLTFLHHIGCKNIEKLLHDSIEQHARKNK